MSTNQEVSAYKITTVMNNSLNIIENIGQTLKRTEINIKKCPKARLTRSYIETRLKCIEQYWHEFMQAHHIIVQNATKVDKEKIPYLVNNEFIEYEDSYINLKSDILELLSTGESLSTHLPMQPVSYSDSQTVRVALPKIQLPTYGGGYEEWLSFHDLFTTLVHDNKALNNVQKLHYLKTTLTGEAAMLLRHIQVTDANYVQAWDLLKSRYGNKRITINAILTRFFSQKKISTQTSNQIKGLLDTTFECINQLKNLKVATENWDPIVIFVIVQKLDSETHKEWEQHVSNSNKDLDSLPNIDMFQKFLENRYRTLELSEPVRHKANPTSVKERSFHIATGVDTVLKCQMCNENHTISHCKDFSKLTPQQRSDVVKTRNLCFNCLSNGHSFKNCRIPLSCRICKRRHHTLLHVKYNDKYFKDTSDEPDNFKQSEVALHANVEESEEEVPRDITLSTSHATTNHSTRLLATAMVHVKSKTNYTTIVRALIDQGSQASFISERAAQSLKAKRHAVRGAAVGLGSCSEEIRQFTYIEILSKCGKFNYNVKVYIISKQLTAKLPSCKMNKNTWPHLEGLVLADASHCEPRGVDLVLGLDMYEQIIEDGLIKGPPGSPCAQKTSLGWILFGIIEKEYREAESVVVMHHQIETEDFLKTLWEIDQDTDRKYTKEEEMCENHYEETYKRDNSGRYIVALPFRNPEPQSLWGNTKEIAMQRLIQHERKMSKTPELHERYNNVLEEYLSMGHMEEVPVNEIQKPSVYLPHHSVVRNDKETTKLRVVFDGSSKGYNGVSLNDELMIGPVIQEDLRSIIMRWRMHKVCFISDITKMYRMICLREEDQDYQRILWRRTKFNEIKHYRLKTVTFGTSSAPYLAIKTLTKLAENEGEPYPTAARVIREDFYVDDLMSGCDTVEEAIKVSNDIQKIMSAGGFELQKWASNDTNFLKAVDPAKVTTKANFDLKLDGVIKALGVSWNFGEDQLQYQLNLEPTVMPITKRNILSDVQRLFDPLGWIAPTIVTAKILMQKLWLEGVSWDETLNQELQDEWQTIREDLHNVQEIKINRWLNTINSEKTNITLHGFCDASEKAYAAVVYCRVQHAPKEIKTHIVAARTRVAPVKTVSLPRLELNGAVLLLAHLIHKASQAMKIPAHKLFAWTDSTIVLSWLFGEPNRWKPFVANRVVDILEHVRNTNWFHVQSAHNPADIASRGSSLSDLRHNTLWWNGPRWLAEEHIEFNKPQIQPIDLERKVIHTFVNTTEAIKTINFEEYDTLAELLRVIVHGKRFLNSKRHPEKLKESISTEELQEALEVCIQRVQEEEFSNDIDRLKNCKTVKSTSNIKSLNPFIDSQNILRVGGRLRKSEQDENMKYPIILGKRNKFVQLLLADAHKRTMHGGIQMMITYLMSKYWIIGCKNLVKHYTRNCLTCARQRAANRHQIMGDLPEARVTPARPFSRSGVDFAGPVQVLNSRGRGARTAKAYICIFVCMAVKAVHLELVSDLTAEAFIAAFRRFVARRGRCIEIWSDNGLNFVAANKELCQLWKENNFNLPDHIAEQLANDGTQWHFIPPYTPNFGGLWEAGVKSIKYHLRRTLTSNLTFEEFATVLTQIEACLNSRPLVPVSTDLDLIDDIQVLTPAHFLIGEQLVAVPDRDYTDIKINNLSRWKYIQQLMQNFWKRWNVEYLSRLSQRTKWLKRSDEFKIGDIVLLKEDNLPPNKWALARIVDKHPRPDNITRVYTVRCNGKMIQRSVNKLCFLPIEVEYNV